MSSSSFRFWAVVPAAGSARRMGDGVLPKQYLQLAGRTVLEWSIAPLLAREDCSGVVVVLAEGDPHWATLAVAGDTRVRTAVGGGERADSVAAGLLALKQWLSADASADADADEWVLVHDAARPCLRPDELASLIDRVRNDAVGGLLAAPLVDTLKRSDGTDRVAETVSRAALWRAMTPQMFRAGLLARALSEAARRGVAVTDESQAVELLGLQPQLVAGSADNIKITVADDLRRADRILAMAHSGNERATMMTGLRVGQGYDVHAFGPGDHVMLGGVKIAHASGVRAHSDGDVVLHALCDALLGAAALGDIGMHFPDSDPQWRGADSRSLLRHVRELLQREGFAVVNVDVTVLAEVPRLGKHRAMMRTNISADLGIGDDRVNIKATTSESMGFIGRQEGLGCHAIALIQRT